MTKPNFFIIGAPKCGTTSMAGWLSQHPNVYMSPDKEPHFYSTDFPVSRLRSKAAYLDLFSRTTSAHQAVGEASVWYLLSKHAVPSINHEDAHAKYIVMLRNPVEMAPSLHWQTVFNGDEDILDFSQAWQLQVARAAGDAALPKHCRAPSLVQYQVACSLGSQLQRLYQTVDEKQVLVLFLEDVERSPQDAWNRTLEFLQVAPFLQVDFSPKNPAKHWRFRSVPNLERAYRKFLGRWNMNPFGLGGIRFLKHFSVKQADRKPLDLDTRKLLASTFLEDVSLLSEITSRDLSHWINTG